MWVLILFPPQSGARFEPPNYLNAVTMIIELLQRTIEVIHPNFDELVSYRCILIPGIIIGIKRKKKNVVGQFEQKC